MSKQRKKNRKSKKKEVEDPFPDQDREDSEAYGYESSALMDEEDEGAE